MMDFITELRAKSENVKNTKVEIIDEIKARFDDYFNSDRFENYLRERIGRDELDKRQVTLYVKFWEYQSGCSTTHFGCGGITWCNPENKDGYESCIYKGIKLQTINFEVCQILADKLIAKMGAMGFALLSQETQTSRFNYYDKHFIFGW